MAAVRKTAPPLRVIYVAGAVSHPGLIRLADGSRVADAVDRAGGFAPGADPASVNLASPLSDGDDVVALKLGDRILQMRTQSRSSARRAPSKRKRKAPLEAIVRIDLNVADEAALGRIPGIGQRLAQRIMLYRQANGPFTSLDELADVAGMSERRIDDMVRFVSL